MHSGAPVVVEDFDGIIDVERTITSVVKLHKLWADRSYNIEYARYRSNHYWLGGGVGEGVLERRCLRGGIGGDMVESEDSRSHKPC